MSGSYHDDVREERYASATWLGKRWLGFKAWWFVHGRVGR